MKTSMVFRILCLVGLTGLWVTLAAGMDWGLNPSPVRADKPGGLAGGIWTDDFLTWQLEDKAEIELLAGHLILKCDPILDWTQTWAAHFIGGEFLYTEVISDSVRLAEAGAGQFFTSGVYTSTVFYAGKPVDWLFAEWQFLGIPPGLQVVFRTGNSASPDSTWTGWTSPANAMNESYCEYIANVHQTLCFSNLVGIASSPYLQYRANFESDDPTQTIALEDIRLSYGTHVGFGTARSALIAPVDLLNWETVILTATVPASTTLTVDVLASDDSVLLSNLSSADELAGIDPHEHPSIRLRATLTSLDPSITPDVDLWGLRWSTQKFQYLPLLFH